MNIWRHGLAHFSRRLAHAVLAGGLGLAALAATPAALAEDDPPGRVGRLADMKGQVWLLEAGQGEWQTAERNRPVTTADRLATDADSRAEVQIGSTIVRLDEGTDLEVTRLDDERVELMLHSGAASLRVREHEVAREVLLITPEGRFQPRSAGLYRVDRSDRGSLAGATAGELEFESSDAQLSLRAGQRAELWYDQGDRRTHYNWAGMPNDEFEQWVRKDDARDERYAAVRRPISPEMTGADDLEGYGRWDTHPEYGSVWYPTAVAVGWAPYRYGRWAWVRPWGWTWVDDAPWGFAPFHYGRWVHWHGRWAWAPGTYVRRPVYAPAMVAWVGGGNFSVGVSFGRPVGWVPLAPREVYRPMYRVSPVYIKQVNITHVHVHDDDRRHPVRPVQYRNSSVAGGVTVVSSDVLTRRERVNNAPRPSDNSVIQAMRGQRPAANFEPPKPADASFAPRQVRRADPAAAPAVAAPRSVVRASRDDDRRGGRPAIGSDRGNDRAAPGQGGQPGNGGRPEPQRPQQPGGVNPREPQPVREPGRAERPQSDERVPRPPVTRELNRDNPRREAQPPQVQAPQPQREPREAREPRGFSTPPQQPPQQHPQREPREERAFQTQPRQERPERQERQDRAERVVRQEPRQDMRQESRQEQRAERQQQREEKQERKRERGERAER